jgi:hypothetical protein
MIASVQVCLAKNAWQQVDTPRLAVAFSKPVSPKRLDALVVGVDAGTGFAFAVERRIVRCNVRLPGP